MNGIIYTDPPTTTDAVVFSPDFIDECQWKGQGFGDSQPGDDVDDPLEDIDGT